jgi:hypothetical protein
VTLGEKVNQLSELSAERLQLNSRIAELQLEVDAGLRELNPAKKAGRPRKNGNQQEMPLE